MEKITSAEYAKFLEHYAWQLLRSPDYRLGQAFCNYFPHITLELERIGELGDTDAEALYYETDVERAQRVIDRYREFD